MCTTQTWRLSLRPPREDVVAAGFSIAHCQDLRPVKRKRLLGFTSRWYEEASLIFHTFVRIFPFSHNLPGGQIHLNLTNVTPQARKLRYKESGWRNSKEELDDDLIATRLAQLGSRKRLYYAEDLCTHGQGRIIVNFHFDENSDQLRTVDCDSGAVFVLGNYPSGTIHISHTPCTYCFPRDMGRFRGDLLREKSR